MNNSSSAPEHDEKSGSFAPRTSGAKPQAPKPRFTLTPKLVSLVAVLLVVVANAVYFFVITPMKEEARAKLHPSRLFIAQILMLNNEEVMHGRGAAAEPPQTHRLVTEKLIQDELKKFPNLTAILSRCVLNLHDMHEIDPTGRILKHYMLDDELAPELEAARQKLQTLPMEENFVLVIRGGELSSYNAQGDLVP